MRKPAIPSPPKKADDRARFDGSLKESLEVIMGRTGNKIAVLDPTTATLANVIDKVNEILGNLQ